MNLKYTLAALLIASSASTAMAATVATQKFTVTVPANISIVAPANVSLTHDETETDQVFPAQQWVVRGNTLAGVNVSISTGSAFQHTFDANSKRDAKVDLAVNSSTGPAAWTVTQATDTTDYTLGDGVATVQVSSDGVGRADLDVTVSFITNGFGTFASGDYETTLTGTIASN